MSIHSTPATARSDEQKSFCLHLGGSGPYTAPKGKKPAVSKNPYWEKKRTKEEKTCCHAAIATFHHLAIATTPIICKSG